MAQLLSLIADPQKAPLTQSDIDTARAAAVTTGAQVGYERWLSPREAWNCTVSDAGSHTLQALRMRFADQPVDVNIVEDIGIRSVLIADMDSTMIGQECIDELADEAGAGDKVRAITARAMNGELAFEDALRERVSTLTDLPEGVITQVIDTRITFAPGARELISTMRAKGAHCALISGGFTHFTSHVAEALGFHEHQANTLQAVDGRLTGTVADPILGQDAKVAALTRISAEHDIKADAALTVGDGANDVPMLKAAGLGVAVHAKPTVREQVPAQINHGDLSGLLYLQNVARDEFVTSH